MAIRVDWQAMRDSIEDNGGAYNAPFLFVLPHGGRHLLMSIIDVLKWEATYRDKEHGYDFSDWDALQAMVEATHYGLMEGEEVVNISESIIYLADKLAENFGESEMNVSQIVNCGCGCSGSVSGGGIADIPDDIPLDTPPPVIDRPPGDVSYVTSDVCAKAHFIALSWRNMILESENGDLTQSRYNNWLNEIFTDTWQWIVSTATVFLETVGILNVVSGGTASAIDSEFENLKCAILQGGSQAEVAARCNAVIENMGRGALTSYYMKKVLSYMPLTAPFDSSVANPPEQYYAAGCPQCADEIPPPVTGLSSVYFDSVSVESGETAYDGLLASGEEVQFGTPYFVTPAYWDVPSQSVDGYKISFRTNDGQGGRADVKMIVSHVTNWNPRPNDYTKSMHIIASDDTVTHSQGDTVEIQEGTYDPCWDVQLAGASESADTQIQYEPFTLRLTFYPAGYVAA